MLRLALKVSLIALCATLAAPPSAAQTEDTPRLTSVQALENDARSYAAAYGVSLDEAKRRMLIMATAGDEIGRLETEVASSLSGAYFDHGGTFSLVIRVVGGSLPGNRTLTINTERTDLGAAQLQLPVRFEASAGVTRTRAKEIVGSANPLLRTVFPTLQGFGYDERTGEMSVLVNGSEAEAALYQAKDAELTERLGMPVRIEVAPVTLATRAVRGGSALYLQDGTAWCTSAFVAKDPGGKTGVLTAGHCGDDAQYWREGTSSYPLSALGVYFNQWEDWAFLVGTVSMLPEFYGNRNEAARVLKGRRTKENTTERTSTTAGSYICAYGRNTGPRYGQTCGEVVNKYYDPNYAHPGCTNGTTFVDCAANFVEIRARGAETMYCAGGDSGAPVFTFDVAWGILSGCSNYANSETAYNLIYTSVDEVYYHSFTLVYGS